MAPGDLGSPFSVPWGILGSECFPKHRPQPPRSEPRALTGAALCRLNSAPVKGFEKDVGSKTTLRITYPEGAMQRPEQYERDSLFVLAGFKWQDFKWLKYIVYKERVVSSPCTGSFPSLPALALPSFQLRPFLWTQQRAKGNLPKEALMTQS